MTYELREFFGTSKTSFRTQVTGVEPLLGLENCPDIWNDVKMRLYLSATNRVFVATKNTRIQPGFTKLTSKNLPERPLAVKSTKNGPIRSKFSELLMKTIFDTSACPLACRRLSFFNLTGLSEITNNKGSYKYYVD